MAKVIAPNKEYTGLSAGVAFANGVGETDNPHLLQWFESKGYEVEKEPEQEHVVQPDPDPDAVAGNPPDDVTAVQLPEDQTADKPAEKPAPKSTKTAK